MNDRILRLHLFELTRPGFRAIPWDVVGRIGSREILRSSPGRYE